MKLDLSEWDQKYKEEIPEEPSTTPESLGELRTTEPEVESDLLQRVIAQAKDSAIASALGAGQGVTASFGDEIVAKLMENPNKTYEENLADLRAKLKEVKEKSPYSYMGGEILGSIVGPGKLLKGAGAVGKLAGLNKYATGALSGAAIGGLTGAGASEGTLDVSPDVVAKDAANAALTGGAFGLGATALGSAVDAGKKEFARWLSEERMGKNIKKAFDLGKEGKKLTDEAARARIDANREDAIELLNESILGKNSLLKQSSKNFKNVLEQHNNLKVTPDKPSVESIKKSFKELLKNNLARLEYNEAGKPVLVAEKGPIRNEVRTFINSSIDYMNGRLNPDKAYTFRKSLFEPSKNEVFDRIRKTSDLRGSIIDDLTKNIGDPFKDAHTQFKTVRQNVTDIILNKNKNLLYEADKTSQVNTPIKKIAAQINEMPYKYADTTAMGDKARNIAQKLDKNMEELVQQYSKTKIPLKPTTPISPKLEEVSPELVMRAKLLTEHGTSTDVKSKIGRSFLDKGYGMANFMGRTAGQQNALGKFSAENLDRAYKALLVNPGTTASALALKQAMKDPSGAAASATLFQLMQDPQARRVVKTILEGSTEAMFAKDREQYEQDNKK